MSMDYGFDEKYMWWYDEDDNYQTPNDPRDDQGYDEWEHFQRFGYKDSMRWRRVNDVVGLQRDKFIKWGLLGLIVYGVVKK